jgi:hypothetical protein
MNYNKVYNALILKAKNRKLDGYTEVHHILPRCLGGKDDKHNLVELTAREHFIAHLLLVKIYNNNLRLVKAVAMMCIGQTERKLTNRLYGKMKELFSLAMSESQSGQKNSQYGTRWIHNLETKETKKISKNNSLPNGWLEGRKIIFEEKDISEKIKAKELKKKELVEKYTYWYELYKKLGFKRFVIETGYDKSKPNLVQNFAKHVESFVPQNGKKRG